MYVVATPSNFKKIRWKKQEKITVSFAFCAHVDVMKIEKHWCFPLSAHKSLELSSSAHVQW